MVYVVHVLIHVLCFAIVHFCISLDIGGKHMKPLNLWIRNYSKARPATQFEFWRRMRDLDLWRQVWAALTSSVWRWRCTLSRGVGAAVLCPAGVATPISLQGSQTSYRYRTNAINTGRLIQSQFDSKFNGYPLCAKKRSSPAPVEEGHDKAIEQSMGVPDSVGAEERRIGIKESSHNIIEI